MSDRIAGAEALTDDHYEDYITLMLAGRDHDLDCEDPSECDASDPDHYVYWTDDVLLTACIERGPEWTKVAADRYQGSSDTLEDSIDYADCLSA